MAERRSACDRPGAAVEAVGVADWVHVMVGGRLRVSEPASAVTGWEDIGRLFLGAEGIA